MQEADMTQAPAERAVHGGRSESLVTILIIEDEPAIRRLLRTNSERTGLPGRRGGDGGRRFGCDRIAGAGPGHAGPRFAGHRWVGDHPTPSQQFFGASHCPYRPKRRKDKGEALDLGADDFVTKPFGAEELVARLRTALRHQSWSKMSHPCSIRRNCRRSRKGVVTVGGNTVKLSRRNTIFSPSWSSTPAKY